MNEQTQTIINAIENIEGRNASQFDIYLMLFDVPQEAIATREMLIAHIGATLDHIANNIIETEFEGCDIDGADWEDVAINLYDIDGLWEKYGVEQPAPKYQIISDFVGGEDATLQEIEEIVSEIEIDGWTFTTNSDHDGEIRVYAERDYDVDIDGFTPTRYDNWIQIVRGEYYLVVATKK